MGDNILRRGVPSQPTPRTRAPTAEIDRQELQGLIGLSCDRPAEPDLEPELELIVDVPEATPVSMRSVAIGRLAHTLKRGARAELAIAISKPTRIMPAPAALALALARAAAAGAAGRRHATSAPAQPAEPSRLTRAQTESLDPGARIRRVLLIVLVAAAFGEVAFLVLRALVAV
jgi:hypothetical protein